RDHLTTAIPQPEPMPYANPPTEPSAPIGPLRFAHDHDVSGHRRGREEPRATYDTGATRRPAASQGHHPANCRLARLDPRTSEWRYADARRPDTSCPPATTTTDTPPLPLPLPRSSRLVHRGSSASTSYVLAALRALHVDPS